MSPRAEQVMSEQSFRLTPAPLYRQVEEHLARQIHDGTYAPGSLLPSDAKLCELFGVSRITIRHALDKLVANRLVRRQHGVGTFVLEPGQAMKTAQLVGSIDDIHPHINFRLLRSALVTPPASFAAAMGLSPGAACRCYVNLNHVGKEPLSFVESYFTDPVAALLCDEDFARHVPPSRLIENRSGRQFQYAEQTMGAIGASEEIAGLLGLPVGLPIMRMERIYFADDGSVIEATVAHYHPQRYQFSVRLLPHSGAMPREVPAPALTIDPAPRSPSKPPTGGSKP